MNYINRLHVKYFLIYGIPYGTMMMLWDFMHTGDIHIGKFIFLTFFFGITMSIFTVHQIENEISRLGVNALGEEV